VIFAVPNRMAAAFIIFHKNSIPDVTRRLKAGDLRIPNKGL
jgi:hypothetical protein